MHESVGAGLETQTVQDGPVYEYSIAPKRTATVDRFDQATLHYNVEEAQSPRPHIADPRKRHFDANSARQMPDPSDRATTESCRPHAEGEGRPRHLKRGHEEGGQGDDDRGCKKEQWNKAWTPEPDTARSATLVDYR